MADVPDEGFVVGGLTRAADRAANAIAYVPGLSHNFCSGFCGSPEAGNRWNGGSGAGTVPLR